MSFSWSNPKVDWNKPKTTTQSNIKFDWSNPEVDCNKPKAATQSNIKFDWSNPKVDWNKPKPTTQSNIKFDWSNTSTPPTFDWEDTSAQPPPAAQEQPVQKSQKEIPKKKSNRIFYQTLCPLTLDPSSGDTPVKDKEPNPESAAVYQPERVSVKEPERTVVKEPECTAVKEPECTVVKQPKRTVVTEPVASTKTQIHGDEIFDIPNNFDTKQNQVVAPFNNFAEGLRYHSQTLPKNAPEVVAEKLKSAIKDIEFTRPNITEGSPWSSDAFVRQLPLPECLKNALYDLKVDRLSKIQKVVIPKLIAGQNVVAQSQSGTGKTITFLVAAFNNVDPNLDKPQILIVLPTLELALQVCSVSDHIGKNNPEVRVRQALRRERFDSDVTEHIVIGTPGKLLELILRLKRIDCTHMKMVVFDEADNLFDVHQNRELMILLKQALPVNVQVVMFSATFTDEFCHFIEPFCPNSEILRLQQEEMALDNIRQLYVKVHNEPEKLSILIRILRSTECGSCFIFTQTKEDASFVYKALLDEGYSVGIISSEYDVMQRRKSLEDLRNGVVRYLVATNVSARGIDIPNVCMVINYSLPHNPVTRSIDYEVYLHRIGRCGRFGKQGIALSFADRLNSEDYIRDLINYFAKPITELTIVDGELSMESEIAVSS